MNIHSIREKLENIDYGWSKPQSYLIFVPGLSLLIQKVQLAQILPLREEDDVTAENHFQVDLNTKKFVEIHKWHLRGSAIQLMASIMAIQACSLPIFSLIALLSMGQFVYTSILGLMTRINSYTFHPNGNIATIVSENLSAFNMF